VNSLAPLRPACGICLLVLALLLAIGAAPLTVTTVALGFVIAGVGLLT
jgi:hypothetical protein